MKEQLLNSLRDLAKRLGTNNLSISQLDNDLETLSSSTYKRVFGSWGRAISLAGLETGKITGRPWNRPIIITEKALEILEGELLGDGSFELATSGNPCFAHSTANLHYSTYLEQKLINADILVNSELLLPRNNAKAQRRIRTQYNQAFRHLYEKWYCGVKIVPKDLVLTKEKCLHWYLGDGYIEGKNSKISTCGFTWNEVYWLAKLVKDLGFGASVDKHSGGYPILRFLTKDSRAFLEWLGPCPVKGYEHRWKL